MTAKMIDTAEMNRVTQTPPRMNGSHSARKPQLILTVVARKIDTAARTTNHVSANLRVKAVRWRRSADSISRTIGATVSGLAAAEAVMAPPSEYSCGGVVRDAPADGSWLVRTDQLTMALG